MAEARQERQELREGMIQLQNVVERLTNVQEGIANKLASLDGDRPTILRKLSTIENKVAHILQREQEEVEFPINSDQLI
ncbi:hypothetical protein WKK05_31790 [Nostoc sp. UHCC 0302]